MNLKEKEDIKKYLYDNIQAFGQKDKESQEALTEYFISVDLLSKGKLNLEFNNKDSLHAAIVMSKIFSTVKSKLYFFCKNLKGDICDNLIYREALEKAIEREVAVDIVFEELPAESECFKKLKDFRNRGFAISFAVLNNDYKEKARELKVLLNHFLIGDERMWRYEFDVALYRATCNFDDSQTAKKLIQNFNALKNNSSKI